MLKQIDACAFQSYCAPDSVLNLGVGLRVTIQIVNLVLLFKDFSQLSFSLGPLQIQRHPMLIFSLTPDIVDSFFFFTLFLPNFTLILDCFCDFFLLLFVCHLELDFVHLGFGEDLHLPLLLLLFSQTFLFSHNLVFILSHILQSFVSQNYFILNLFLVCTQKLFRHVLSILNGFSLLFCLFSSVLVLLDLFVSEFIHFLLLFVKFF